MKVTKIEPEDHLTLKLRGRIFTQSDIHTIKLCVDEKREEGRTAISLQVCRKLKWVQPNGMLKDRACREVLRKLEALGYINLPEPKKKLNRAKKKLKNYDLKIDIPQKTITEINFKKIVWNQVKGTKDERTWNHLIQEYHYLGHKVIVGRNLKYIATVEDNIIGLLGWGEPAWSLKCRDDLLLYLNYNYEMKRINMLNNVRFLIPPWVNVTNLASNLLSKSIYHLQTDWQKYYNTEVLLLETFVDAERYLGTCYKAANWINIGESKGFTRRNNQSNIHNSKKLVFVYPIKKNQRKLIYRFLDREENLT